MNSNVMNISEIARQVGASTHTIRYYEKIGILEGVDRDDNGYRLYGPRDVYVLKLALRGRKLGLTLKEIKELADRFQEDPTEQTLVRNSIKAFFRHLSAAREKRQEIDGYIALLEEEIGRLTDLL